MGIIADGEWTTRKVVPHHNAYDASLRNKYHDMMEVLDEVVVRLAMPVIIRPNLVTTTMPDDDILTYPLIVRRAAEDAVAEIARPFVADGSRMHSSEKV